MVESFTPMDCVCTCLYYNFVDGAIRLPMYFRRPTQLNSTERSRSYVHLWADDRRSCDPVDWGRRLVPLGRVHARTRTPPLPVHTLSHAHYSSRPPAIAYSESHTHTHADVCARRKTRTKFDDVDARALSDSGRRWFMDSRRTGWGTAEETKLENRRRTVWTSCSPVREKHRSKRMMYYYNYTCNVGRITGTKKYELQKGGDYIVLGLRAITSNIVNEQVSNL